MKKFSPYILILVVMVGLFSPVSQVKAQTVTGCYNNDNVIQGTPPLTQDQCSKLGSSVHWVDVPGTSATDPSFVGPVQPSTTPDSNACSLFSAGTWGDCLNGYILAPLAYLLLGIAAFILWVAGTILNFVLNYTIVEMSAHINGGTLGPGLTGINIAWKVLRDLMNIAFIFLLVYEGILMIIGQSSTAKIKTFITGIVLASLLINFSLFFTKVMIDASNIVTIGFYNSILNSNTATVSGDTTTGGNKTISGGLSAPFMNALGLTGFYSGDSFAETSKKVGGGTNMLIFFVMGIVVFLVVSFVFFAVACMFVIRYVALIILLMLSPIAYMGMALPFMKGYADDWWKAFNSQLLFAPIYMLMTWVILTLMTSPDFISKGDWGAVTSGDPGSISLIFNFVVIIALVITSLIIAKNTSTKGSKHIGDATGKLTAFAGGALLGGASRIGRGTLGRAGNAIAGSEGLKSFAFKTDEKGNVVARGGIGGFAARQTLKGGDTAAKSTFDVRSTGQFKNLAKQTGVDFGKGAEAKNVSFQKDLEAKGKKEAEFAKLLKPSDEAVEKMKNERNAKGTGQGDLEDKEKEAKSNLNKSKRELERLQKEEERLRKSIDTAGTMAEEIKIREEMANIQNLAKVETENVASLTKASEAAGETSKANENAIKGIFEKRVNAYADTFSNESPVSKYGRYVANFIKVGGGGVAGVVTGGAGGTVAGALGGGSIVTTASDRKAIAKFILKGAKEKSRKEKIADLAIEQTKEEEEEKKKAEGGAEPSTEPPAGAPTPPPPPPPAPPPTPAPTPKP